MQTRLLFAFVMMLLITKTSFSQGKIDSLVSALAAAKEDTNKANIYRTTELKGKLELISVPYSTSINLAVPV